MSGHSIPPDASEMAGLVDGVLPCRPGAAKVAVIGGGINGLCSALKLSYAGCHVTLFEQGALMQGTSSASSKLLHGGLRYLENGEFRLVKEALAERDGWIRRVPELAHPLSILYPIYRHKTRTKWLVWLGMSLYALLARKSPLSRFRWLPPEVLSLKMPRLKMQGLSGAFEFFDGQMDDYQLGLWVAEQCRGQGVVIHEHTKVAAVTPSGRVALENGGVCQFDRVVNVAGPSAEQLLASSGLSSPVNLDLIRGSHLVINRPCTQAYLLEVPSSRRIFFVLPWKGHMLIGTTEIRQALTASILCSDEEKKYLLAAYNEWMDDAIGVEDILESFAGLRPLLSSSNDPARVSREYVVHRNQCLVSVFGGKWTTSMALAEKVKNEVLK